MDTKTNKKRKKKSGKKTKGNRKPFLAVFGLLAHAHEPKFKFYGGWTWALLSFVICSSTKANDKQNTCVWKKEKISSKSNENISKCDQDRVQVHSLECFLTTTKRPSNQTKLQQRKNKNKNANY